MTLDEAIKHCEEVAEKQEKIAIYTPIEMLNSDDDIEKCLECANEHRQLAEWLKILATISDMLDGTIDHLSGDDAKELLNDIKWELKPIRA